tara:strand:- start:333 stop:542 length:210 start_codon:yes stop_codon:yes gene_type:complete
MKTFQLIIYENGEKYEGEVLNGKRHGYGKFTFKTGTVVQGIWINDEFSIRNTERNQIKQVQKNIKYKDI